MGVPSVVITNNDQIRCTRIKAMFNSCLSIFPFPAVSDPSGGYLLARLADQHSQCLSKSQGTSWELDAHAVSGLFPCLNVTITHNAQLNDTELLQYYQCKPVQQTRYVSSICILYSNCHLLDKDDASDQYRTRTLHIREYCSSSTCRI